jgi:hypothetical protein
VATARAAAPAPAPGPKPGPAAPAAGPGSDLFESKIRPLLTTRCFECHSHQAKKLKSDLYLDSRDGILTGGERGPAIVPGDAGKSRLIEAVSYTNPDLQMPPKGRLTADEIAALTQWINQGAPWPSGETSAQSKPKKPKFDLAQRKAEYWCWQPIGNPTPPRVRDEAWPLDDLDRFILAALEAKNITPAPQADKRMLIRRAYFDLIGLPPSPAEVDAFLADTSAGAFAKVIDHLLASPHFGERWGRHWLDLVRYAETFGHEFDFPIRDAWRYRDYVIRAFNADVPYDQLVLEHVAGDLLPNPRLSPARRSTSRSSPRGSGSSTSRPTPPSTPSSTRPTASTTRSTRSPKPSSA